MSPSPARRSRLAVMVAALSVATGCPEWLEIGDDSEPEDQAPLSVPAVQPTEPARYEAPGPLVPRTPGLRVPLAGYWTRVRLDTLDVVFPFSWASLSVASDGSREEAFALLRLEGSSAQGDVPSEIGAQGVTGLHAVIPIELPIGTDLGAIREGFELPREALAQAMVALRTSSQDIWLVTATHMRFDEVTPRLISGAIEGEARRGTQGQHVRRFSAAFFALRAPD